MEREKDAYPLPQPTLAQRSWRRFCVFMVGVFYRRFEAAGLANLPAEGPVILCANHVNALVDAVVVQASCPRPIHPLARSGLFRSPLLRPVLALIQAVPIYRRRRGAEEQTAKANVDSFRRCYEYLEQGRILLIFPEGQSHSDPTLRPLKTGAARLALGLWERTGRLPAVVPVGLVFPQKGRFRSEVLVQIAPPVAIPAEDAAAEDAPRRLTESIGEGLERVTLNADSWEDIQLLRLLNNFFAMRSGRRRSLAQRFRSLQRLIDTHRWLRLTRPVEVRLLGEKLRRFEDLCEHHGVEDYHLNLRYRPALVARFLLRSTAFLFFVAPLALWGFLNSAVPYFATRFTSRRAARGRDQYDTAGMLFGLFFFLAFWGAQTFAVFHFWGTWSAVGYGASLLVTSAVALRVGKERKRITENVRVFFLFLRRRELQAYLRIKRQELEVELARMARLARGGLLGSP